MRSFLSIAKVSRIAFFVALVAITTLAVMPADDVSISLGWDKANHVLAFFVLFWVMDYAWPKELDVYQKCLFLLLYGLILEFLQFFSVSRDFSLIDMVADGVGLLFYIVLRPLLFAKFRYWLVANTFFTLEQ